LELGFVARPASAEKRASSGSGICLVKGLLASAQNRKGCIRYLALVVTLVTGLILPVGRSFGQTSQENSSPDRVEHPKSVNRRASGLDARLVLRVYRYARIDPELLEAAEKVAAEIFENVGIRTEWMECPATPGEAEAYPACQSEMGSADLVVRLLPQRMAEKIRASEEALGFAQTCPESEPACELSVFYARIDKLAADGYRADRILGYVMAHEVAHVLIGPGHSDEGIMRREWSPHDLQRISWGLTLDFTRDQAKRLRFAVQRRTKPRTEESTTQAQLIAR
jgi:hypothetical protein